MKDICNKYAIKTEANLNSLIFLYGGNQINFEKKFKEQVNSLDCANNEMKVLI